VRGVSDVGYEPVSGIVPLEGHLEFLWDAEKCWCFIHVAVTLVLGTTQLEDL